MYTYAKETETYFMTTYTFNAYGNTRVYVAEDIARERAIQYTEAGDDMVAMALANREMLWSNPDAREGNWVLDDELITAYKWVETNTYKLLAGGYLD
jgi:hypothetical protein